MSCIGVPAGVPGGIRAVAAENLIAMLLDLESTTSNDQTFTHPTCAAWPVPCLSSFSGTDYICSGYSATPNYDNMFAGSNWDAEDYDDWTIIQRDMKIDGGLQPVREEDVPQGPQQGRRALQGMFRELGLPGDHRRRGGGRHLCQRLQRHARAQRQRGSEGHRGHDGPQGDRR